MVVTSPAPGILLFESFGSGGRIKQRVLRERSREAGRRAAFSSDPSAAENYMANTFLVRGGYLLVEWMEGGGGLMGSPAMYDSLWLRKASDGSLVVRYRAAIAGLVFVVPVAGFNDEWFRFAPK